jgi:hypothetical protein
VEEALLALTSPEGPLTLFMELTRSFPRVSPASLLLSLLIVLRLLMPPGICVCKLSCPASRLLAAVCGSELPTLPGDEADDDHNPGCPACYLAQGLGVAPPSGPGPLFLTLTGSVLPLPPCFPALADGFLPAVCSDDLSSSGLSMGIVRPLLC